MKMPKKVLSLAFTGLSLLGLGAAANAQEAGPPPAPVGAVEVQTNNAAAPQITQADVDNFAYNVGVQTAFPLAKEGFSQGTLRNGQHVGLQFVLDGNNKATGYSVYNLDDRKSQGAFQDAIDNANNIEKRLESERYSSGYSTPVVYPESYIICTPVYVPPLWGFGWGYGYRVGFWEPVIWPGFVYMGGWGYHGGYGGWDRDGWGHEGHFRGGVRNDIRNTTINNTTINNYGNRGGAGHNDHWATGNRNQAPTGTTGFKGMPLPNGGTGPHNDHWATGNRNQTQNGTTGFKGVPLPNRGTADGSFNQHGNSRIPAFNQPSGAPSARVPYMGSQQATPRFSMPQQSGGTVRGGVEGGAVRGNGGFQGGAARNGPAFGGGGGGHHR